MNLEYEEVDNSQQKLRDEEPTEPQNERQQPPSTREQESTRRSPTREKKPRKVPSTNTINRHQLFQDMNLKTNVLEGHHHDICSVDMYDKFVVSGG